MMKRMQGGNGNGRHRDRDRSRSGNNNSKRGYFGGGNTNQSDPQHDRRTRAKALQNIDKYAQMARDALSNGDFVLAEHYHQHGDHYYRVAASLGEMPQQQGFAGYTENTSDAGGNNVAQPEGEGVGVTSSYVAEDNRPQERFQRDNNRSFEPREQNRQRYQQQQPDAHFPARHAEQEGDAPRDTRDNNGQQRFRPYNNRRPQHNTNRSFQPRDGEQPQRVAPQSAEKIDAAFLFGALPVTPVPAAVVAPAPVAAFAAEGGIVTAPKRRGRPPRVKTEDSATDAL
jgi:hypothetical protein